MLKNFNKLLATSLITVILIGCGGGSSTNSKNTTNNKNSNNEYEARASNIPYLKQNHSKYSQAGSSMTPAPAKDASKLSIDWTIEANSEEGAKKLAEHINFMVNKLKNGATPRAWDKLFLMEAYMKQNHYYTTSVERDGKLVVISKVAKNRCAYDVISAHSDAVSGDFFGRGVINKDYSSIAENILNSSECSSLKSSIESFISTHKKSRGMR